VTEALALTRDQKNVYYDLSIATNAHKAKIIADFVNQHPETASRILIGTDFPVGGKGAPVPHNQVNALLSAGLRPELANVVVRNDLPRHEFWAIS
jgi:predicted TIM-barrel fold metal-dependent hydrolase